MPISTGIVTIRSTSSGDQPGTSVATCTWILVTSGNASTESFRAASTPNASPMKATTMMISRCL